MISKSAASAIALSLAIAATTPLAAQTLPFEGTRENVNPLTPPGGRCVPPFFNTVTIAPGAISSTGTSNLGPFTSAQSHCITSPPPTQLVEGEFRYTFRAGDSIIGTYSGNAADSGTPGVFNTIENLTITGGTGRFTSATGSITSSGTLSFGPGPTGIFQGTVAGGINASATVEEEFGTALGEPAAATGRFSTSVGAFSIAAGERSVALGAFAEATNTGSIALGDATLSSGPAAVALGQGAVASAAAAHALGHNSIASGVGSFAGGVRAQASTLGAVAVGRLSNASGDRAVAIGNEAAASSTLGTALGASAQASGLNATAIGVFTRASGMGASAVGNGATATNIGTLAAGVLSSASGQNGTAVGRRANAQGLSGSAFGNSAAATGENSTALGVATVASGLASTALGDQAVASGVASSALGHNSDATALGSTAVGVSAQATQNFATAVGRLANAAHAGSTAIGQSATTTAANQVALGATGTSVRVGDIGASTAAQSGTVSVATVDASGTLGSNATIIPSIAALQSLGMTMQGQIGSLFDLAEVNRQGIRRGYEGVAMALAMDSPNLSSSGRFAISGGYRFLRRPGCWNCRGHRPDRPRFRLLRRDRLRLQQRQSRWQSGLPARMVNLIRRAPSSARRLPREGSRRALMTNAALEPPAPRVHRKPLPPWRLVLTTLRNPLEAYSQDSFRLPSGRVRLLGRTIVTVNHPDGVKHVLTTHAARYSRPVSAKRSVRWMMGNGLFVSEGETWRRRRKLLAPQFSPAHVSELLPHFREAGRSMLARLKDQSHANLTAEFNQATLDAVLRALFSAPADRLGVEIARLTRYFLRGPGRPRLSDVIAREEDDFPLLSGSRRRFQAQWHQAVDALIVRRQKDAGDRKSRDLLDFLLAASDRETDAALSAEEVRDETATMLFAGFETTARLLSWAAYLLALDQREQTAVKTEVEAFPPEQVLDLADMHNWPRLRCVLLEALRLYPPVPQLVRQALEPDEVLGERVEPGDLIWISPWTLHRHRDHWEYPTAFFPERFAGQAQPWTHGAFIPFGSGPRICIGASFSMAEAQILLASLLGRFQFDLVAKRPVLPVGLTTTVQDHEPRFRLRPVSEKPLTNVTGRRDT